MSANPVQIVITKDNPLVSVIIPSLDGFRGGNVPKLLDDLKGQTLQDFEIIIVKGVSPNGRARNEGVKQAKGKYFVCIDDDVRLGNNKILENLIALFLDAPRRAYGLPSGTTQNALRTTQDAQPIGLTGASQLIPSEASYFQKIAVRQLTRTHFPVVDKITETDMVSHMCLAIPTQLYKDIGWESDVLKSGTDPDLRYRIRQAGYKIVVVPQTWAYHPLPSTMTKILKMSYAKGKEAAWVRRHHPEMVYELADGFVSDFPARHSFAYRIIRMAGSLIASLLSGNLINAANRLSYITGYLRESIRP